VPPWLLGAAFALLAALLAFRGSRRVQLRETRPHGFAAVRVLFPNELTSYFGVYTPGRADLFGFAFVVVWLSALASLASFFTLPPFGATLVSVAVMALVGATVYAESRSSRVIGPERVAYVSPCRFLSWSLPLVEVVRCEVVPGSPTPRLRVYTRQGSRSLPLTVELWRALSAGYA
jgi:hypothetical protein